MLQALLIGKEPPMDLGFSYTQDDFQAVVIGSVSLGQLLHFSNEAVLAALAVGMPVYLYTPGLPQAPKNRALTAALNAAQRELKSWGVLFTDGSRRHLITAEEARHLKTSGRLPEAGAVLTPLAKEILEGKQ